VTLFLVLIFVIALGLWAISRLPKAPAGDNVLTDAEALALDAGDEVEKAVVSGIANIRSKVSD